MTTTWFQTLEELLKEAVLVIHVQYGISAVDNVIEAVWILHRLGILDMKLYPMLHSSTHLVPPLICNLNHVLAQVNAVHVKPVLAGCIKGRPSDAAANIQHLHTILTLTRSFALSYCMEFIRFYPYLQIKLIEELCGCSLATCAYPCSAVDLFKTKDFMPLIQIVVEELLELFGGCSILRHNNDLILTGPPMFVIL